MEAPQLIRGTSHGVTLLGDPHRPCGVTLAFTERTGGVSTGDFASLNLDDKHCADSAEHVAQNRDRALRALGCSHLAGRLVCPNQVHGTRVVTVSLATEAAVAAAQRAAAEGADAVVCTVPEVPVLLCYADCVPVVLVAPGGFAVVHSGWRGTLGRISQKALAALCEAVGCPASEVRAYIGPHIMGEDYEVGPELLSTFVKEFGDCVAQGPHNLSLQDAIVASLTGAGMDVGNIAEAHVSTPRATDRFFSYRASGGSCGRHGALAWMAHVERDGR